MLPRNSKISFYIFRTITREEVREIVRIAASIQKDSPPHSRRLRFLDELITL